MDPRDPGETRARTPTILLVEDEAAVLRLATTILEREGFRVVAARNVDAALAAADDLASAPALLITDARLPGGRGETIVETLRQRWPGLPALLVSGHPEETIEVPEDAGFLGKPFGPDRLVGEVHRRLDGTGSDAA
ncbi:MAG: response regulator [Gemmatimonadota bacterium]|nr:response regulator [Gemmatimonadota bacterium]